MSYDKPNRLVFMFGNTDFGAGADVTLSIRLPKGKAGRLWDYGVQGTLEVFNGSSTTPKIAVGSASDPDAYGEEFDLNGLAANDAKTVRHTYDQIADATNFAAQMVARDIPKDTEIVVTCTGAAGSPTGQGVPYVVIDVDD